MARAAIIIGFMGTGKTAAGSRLAELLDWDFVDADREMEEEMGMTIPEAFATRGEDYFREQEEETVIGLIDAVEAADRGCVISLGGGAVTSGGVRKRLERERLVILLDEDVDTAFARASDGSRPLASDALDFRQLFEERTYLYRQTAKQAVDTRGKGVEEVATEMEALVKAVMEGP